MHRATVALLAALLLLGSRAPLPGQSRRAVVAVTPRIATGILPGSSIARPLGVGLDLELVPSARVAPTLRLEQWDFGIYCVGLEPCPSGVDLAMLGARVRGGPAASALIPYVGADVGRMRWTSGAAGWSLRGRAGADVRLLRALDLRLDGGFTRFHEQAAPRRRMLDDRLVSASAGLRLRL